MPLYDKLPCECCPPSEQANGEPLLLILGAFELSMLGVVARYCRLGTWTSETPELYGEFQASLTTVWWLVPPTTTNPNQNNSRLATLFTTVFSFWPWSLLTTPCFLSVSNSACLLSLSLLNFMLFRISKRVDPESVFRIKIVLSTAPDPFVLHVYVCVHVFPCVSASVWGHMCNIREYAFGGQPCLPLLSSPSRYLSPNTEVASAASPNSQPAPGPETASHLVLEIGFQAYLTFLCACWWFELRFACLPGQHFIHWTLSLFFYVNSDSPRMGAGLGRDA